MYVSVKKEKIIDTLSDDVDIKIQIRKETV